MCLQISEKRSSVSVAEHFKQISKCIRVKKNRTFRGTNQTEIKLNKSTEIHICICSHKQNPQLELMIVYS